MPTGPTLPPQLVSVLRNCHKVQITQPTCCCCSVRHACVPAHLSEVHAFVPAEKLALHLLNGHLKSRRSQGVHGTKRCNVCELAQHMPCVEAIEWGAQVLMPCVWLLPCRRAWAQHDAVLCCMEQYDA